VHAQPNGMRSVGYFEHDGGEGRHEIEPVDDGAMGFEEERLGHQLGRRTPELATRRPQGESASGPAGCRYSPQTRSETAVVTTANRMVFVSPSKEIGPGWQVRNVVLEVG